MSTEHTVTRGFATIAEGQVHYHTAGNTGDAPPIFALHASPASSTALVPLIAEFAPHRLVIAPDTLGNGESVAPGVTEPDMAYFADAAARVADALGHEQVDIYGSHTGAHIAIEWAIARPEQVRRVVLDGIAYLPGDVRAEFLANYAPHKQPDAIGSQFHWAWNWMRDQMIFYPHFKKDAEHLRAAGTFDARVLHTLTLDVLRALETYHMPYEAVFNHDLPARLPLVAQPAQCLVPDDDYLDDGTRLMRELLPNARFTKIADHHQYAAMAAEVIAFLEEDL